MRLVELGIVTVCACTIGLGSYNVYQQHEDRQKIEQISSVKPETYSSSSSSSNSSLSLVSSSIYEQSVYSSSQVENSSVKSSSSSVCDYVGNSKVDEGNSDECIKRASELHDKDQSSLTSEALEDSIQAEQDDTFDTNTMIDPKTQE